MTVASHLGFKIFLLEIYFVSIVNPFTYYTLTVVPSHVPSPCSLEQLFSHCLNIRAVPKKVHPSPSHTYPHTL